MSSLAKCIWNMDSIASSKKIQVPEIILQTASVEKNFQKIANTHELTESDGIIAKEASLAYELLQADYFDNKYFLRVISSLMDFF